MHPLVTRAATPRPTKRPSLHPLLKRAATQGPTMLPSCVRISLVAAWPLPVFPIGRGGWQPTLPLPLLLLLLLFLQRLITHFLMDSRVIVQYVQMDFRVQQI